MTPRQTIKNLLDAHAAKGLGMYDDEIHGYLTAWVSGPDLIADHLPQISADIIGDAPLNDEEKNCVIQAALAWADELKTELAQQKLPKLLISQNENGEDDYFFWCNAYFYAVDTMPTDWFATAADEDFEDLFFPVMALSGIYEDDDLLADWSSEQIADLQDEVHYTAQAVFRYWQAVKNKPQTVRREGEKTGRNDPCPCGSGKKYKACCGRS